jgi:hypothetical protein
MVKSIMGLHGNKEKISLMELSEEIFCNGFNEVMYTKLSG